MKLRRGKKLGWHKLMVQFSPEEMKQIRQLAAHPDMGSMDAVVHAGTIMLLDKAREHGVLPNPTD